jgi:hypothetical protein
MTFSVAGVTIPARYCAAVASVLGAWVRRTYDLDGFDRGLLVLIDELDAVSRATGDGRADVISEPIGRRMLDVNAVARLLHRSPRQVRRYCASGRLVAHRQAGRWVIEDVTP